MPATDFHVQGPTTISWRVGGGEGNWTLLGYTDNEDLVRLTSRDHVRTFSRNDQGDMIGEAVFSGTTVTLDFTLASWDQNNLVSLLNKCRTGATSSATAAEGSFATVGGTISSRSVGIRITPSQTKEIIYELNNLMLASGPEYIDFGNTIKRIALSFQTLAPVSGTVNMVTSANP